MPCIFVTLTQLAKFLEIVSGSSSRCLSYIVVMDVGSWNFSKFPKIPAEFNLKSLGGITVLSLEDFVERNKYDKCEYIYRDPEDMISICFTSGSTGTPKGTVRTDLSVLSSLSVHLSGSDPIVELSFAPLSHGTQHGVSMNTFGGGGRIGLYSGEMENLFDDSRALRPTFLVFPPRIYNKLHDEFRKVLDSETKTNPGESENSILSRVQTLFRDEMFGGRVMRVTTGGAPTSPGVIQFLKDTFNCSVSESYGSTETGSISVNGIKLPEVNIKLVDVPELEYFSTDWPNPRGELWVASRWTSPGYFKDPTNNALNFCSNWVCTGDIVEYVHETGEIKIIDRKKNIFKLSQGEFVAPEKLEVLFMKSCYVKNCFIYGNSMQAYVVGVVIPNLYQIREWLDKNTSEGDEIRKLAIPSQINHPAIKAIVLNDLTALGQHQLRNYEIPRDIYLETNLWTQENGLLTPSLKLNRLALKKHYKSLLEGIYQKLNLQDKLLSLKRKIGLQGSSSGMNDDGSEVTQKFVEQGIDSISAIRIQQIISSDFQVKVPLNILMEPSTNLETISDFLRFSNMATDFIDWDAEIQIPSEIYSLVRLSPKYCISLNPKHILLTGATGLVGIHLLEILLISTEAVIHCIVRGKERKTAMARLKESLESYCLWEKLGPFWDTRVVVIPGDLGQPLLGLEQENFEMLCSLIDVIYHNGCLVNTIFPYSMLKHQNVTATLEILKLSLTHHLKPIIYTSTLSVFGMTKGIRKETTKPVIVKQLHNNGYSSSKLISELILEQVAKEWSNHVNRESNESNLHQDNHEDHHHGSIFPLIIVRLGTITGHSISGVTNKDQFINRYIAGIISLGYAPDLSNTLDMLPVDYCVTAMYQLSNPKNFGKIFHLFNLEKAPSILQITKMLNDFGNNIATVSFQEWRGKLTALQEVQLRTNDTSMTQEEHKDNPLLPLLHYFDHHFPTLGHCFDDTLTRQTLSREGILQWPPTISREIICRYASYLLKS
eukprot:TRINITY_DN8064_c0_g1_i8.p1 TRINITY_DN8064_c0_g1~~TRINITY_DN8064_c0_g1_i8.p1  ORF type:complete len:998 (-),score=214.16 TRINITY_DN8064_c0_g1_i8:325-3318(-)